MNPFSRGSKLLTLALKSKNVTDALVSDDEDEVYDNEFGENYFEENGSNKNESNENECHSKESECDDNESNENESQSQSKESECDDESNENESNGKESNENESDKNGSSKSHERERDGNECGERECVELKGGENNVFGGDEHDESELDISTSQLLPLTTVNTLDYNPNTSFSEYMPSKVSILRTGNTMTNTTFSCFHLRPRGEYLDLSTGQVNVVDRDNNCNAKPSEHFESAEAVYESPSQFPQDVETHLECHSLPLSEEENPLIESPMPGTTIQHESPYTEPIQTGEERMELLDGAHSRIQSNMTEVEQTEPEEDIMADIEAIHKEHGTKKKRKADPKSWERQINKKKRESGKGYVGRKYTSKDQFILENKPAKSMRDRCGCKTSFTECNTLTDEDRQEIFGTVWKLEWAEKKQFVSAMTFKKDVSKRTTKEGESSRRSDTIIYTEVNRRKKSKGM